MKTEDCSGRNLITYLSTNAGLGLLVLPFFAEAALFGAGEGLGLAFLFAPAADFVSLAAEEPRVDLLVAACGSLAAPFPDADLLLAGIFFTYAVITSVSLDTASQKFYVFKIWHVIFIFKSPFRHLSIRLP